MDLFDHKKDEQSNVSSVPLAERMRPKSLEEFIGQQHLIGQGKVLRQAIENDQLVSMIFWGPPGVGKTTLARIIAGETKSEFFAISAVTSGVKEVRKIIEQADFNRTKLSKRTILFIDEIHRFNKAQQDALLHSIEDGTILLIGATTENPSFEVISPLLSRARVYTLEHFTEEEIETIIDRALLTDNILLKNNIQIEEKSKRILIRYSTGDARIALNAIELASQLATQNTEDGRTISAELMAEVLQKRTLIYDKKGDYHYDIISAFIKSIRGSDPDAAVYWLARMLDGGEDPKFIARRMIILASEDIGNAHPQALVVATSAFTAINYIGMPEAQIVLSQAVTYLASVPKSNASYMAINEAMQDVKNSSPDSVPLHLRNAPTKFMEQQDYGKDYKYPHDFPHHFVDETYLPQNKQDKIYYKPTEQGYEKTIKERLDNLWKKRRTEE